MPRTIRAQVLDLKAREQRGVEEVKHCIHEMAQTHSYFADAHQAVRAALDAEPTILSTGERALLLQKLQCIERRCCLLKIAFAPYTAIDSIEQYFASSATTAEHDTCHDGIELEVDNDTLDYEETLDFDPDDDNE